MEVSEKRMVTSQKIKRKYIVCTKKKGKKLQNSVKKKKKIAVVWKICTGAVAMLKTNTFLILYSQKDKINVEYTILT